MPEDRFGDLDPAERRAADRLAELDAEDAQRDEPPPPRRAGSRYGWVVGVAAFLVIAIAAVNSLPNSGRGREGPEAGETLPDFAAPSVRGESEADANIRQQGGGSDEEGAVSACQVRGEDVVNVCELRERPVVLTFVAPGCEDALDAVEAVRPEFPRVSFVGVIIGESRDDIGDEVEGSDWRFPVALDPDNAVFNLYRAADCPTTVTAEAGGEVVATRNGPLSDEELRAAAREVARSGGGPA